MLFNKRLLVFCVVLLTFFTTNANRLTNEAETMEIRSNSRALMGQKTQSWQEGFMSGSSGCISVIKNGVICGWTAVSAGFKCAWSYIKCIIPKCSKCCAKGWFSWACVPCKCSWNCSSKKCKEEFNKVGKACKITADDCIKAFNGLGNATKKFFQNVANGIKFIANKIAHAAKWVAEKAWAAVKWVWDKIKSLLDLIKIFEVAKAIGNAFACFGKLGSKSQIESASKNAGNVKGVAESQGKNGVISKIDSFIPGFKAFVCCLQSTAIGRVLNKWGKSLLNFHKNWKGLKVGSFIDDPAIVVSLAASVFSGYSVGTSLDIAFSTAFNVGLYWTVCAGFVTDVGAGVSIVVNLFRKWTFIPGQSVAISFSVGIPETPIGVGVGVVLPIGANSIDFGAVNVEVGASNGVSPVSVGGHVCDTKELVSFNLLELIGNILTANNECPTNIPTNSGGSSSGGSSGGSPSTKTLSGSNVSRSEASDAYNHCCFSTTMSGRVSAIKVSYKWKDQGWGNRKGSIQLQAFNGNSKIATLTIANGVAPHGWTTISNYNVPSTQLGNLRSGTVLKLYYRVGGGGGHRLYVNDFKVTLYYNGQQLEQQQQIVTIEATENVEAYENMEAMDDIANRRLMRNYILKSHKDKMIANNELILREEIREKRRLEMEKEEEARVAAMENDSSKPPPKEVPKADPCAASNLDGALAFLKNDKLDTKTPQQIAAAFCKNKCLKPNENEKGDSECTNLRADMCNAKYLGGGLTTLRACCVALTQTPENLIFRARKFCTKFGKLVKPTKAAFCKAARSSAAQIAKDYDLLNTIMDGCAQHFNDARCRNLANESTAAGLARVANTLCPQNTILQSEHLSGAVAGGLAISALLIAFGVKKLRSNKNEKEIAYEQIPEF